jgi:hypothetical protein
VLSDTLSYADFVKAGQDAFALVPFLAHFMGGECKLKAVNLQITAYPEPKVMIVVADAAAIKVRPLYVYLFKDLRPSSRSVGGHNLSCQVS